MYVYQRNVLGLVHAIGTRELKQNPRAVIHRVLDSGDGVQVTAYGRPTGVGIVPDGSAPQRWVTGSALVRHLTSMGSDEAARLRAGVEAQREGDPVQDPWEPGA